MSFLKHGGIVGRSTVPRRGVWHHSAAAPFIGSQPASMSVVSSHLNQKNGSRHFYFDPGSPTVGDVAIVFSQVYNASAYTWGSNWTTVGSTVNSSGSLYIAGRVIDGTENWTSANSSGATPTADTFYFAVSIEPQAVLVILSGVDTELSNIDVAFDYRATSAAGFDIPALSATGKTSELILTCLGMHLDRDPLSGSWTDPDGNEQTFIECSAQAAYGHGTCGVWYHEHDGTALAANSSLITPTGQTSAHRSVTARLSIGAA